MSVWGAIGGSVISAMTGRRDNLERRKERKKANHLNVYMSNTAYQRAMKDMREGGLNPMLAGQFGAASSPQAAMANLSSGYQDAVSSGMDFFKKTSDVRLNDARTAVTKVEEILKTNLIPGSEAISTVAGALADLAKPADSILRNWSDDYSAGANDLKRAWETLNIHAEKAGIDMQTVFIKLKTFLGSKWNEMKDSIQFLRGD
jgi:hypothetical protein